MLAATPSIWHLIVAGVLLGRIACAFAAMANLVVVAAPPGQVGIATGINTVMRTVGGSFGAATAVAILASDAVGGSALPSESAYTTAFWFSTSVALVAAATAQVVPGSAAVLPFD